MSEELTYDTSFVYLLQKQLTAYLKSHYPQLTEVECFSDGCGGQYKNFKNFLNLTYNHSDFGKGLQVFFCHKSRKITL